MRWCLPVLCVLVALAALATAVPVPDARPETLEDSQAQLPAEVQERLSALQLDEQQLEQVTRDKRTIAVLRQLFPGLGQLIDRKIQQITQYLFRTIGRLVLRGGLGGGGGGAAAAAGGGEAGASPNRRISITLPTFPPDSEEDEDEEAATAMTTTTQEAGSEGSPTELNPEENQLAGAESEVNEVRAQYAEGNGLNHDQEAAASGGNDVPDPANIAIENEEDADRDKRQFSFGGGSSGGSGNFLFDIIRLVSGGSSSGANSEASTDGTGASGGEKDEGYGDGIPGPVTRLFIIANRGIANLIQDLILRIAQTSERLVNFKARLITSII